MRLFKSYCERRHVVTVNASPQGSGLELQQSIESLISAQLTTTIAAHRELINRFESFFKRKKNHNSVMSSECEHVLVSFLCDSKLNVINISHFISLQSCEQNKLNRHKNCSAYKKTLIVKSKK